jgi:copper(I)-binding protein
MSIGGSGFLRKILQFRRLTLLSLALFALADAARAGEIEIARAWIAPVALAGSDAPLQMVILNKSAEPDALIQVRCPVANFSEKYVVDHGEGAPALREVSSIMVGANGNTTLAADKAHVMLLQTRQPLVEGDRFVCSVSFRKAGHLDVTIDVSSTEPALR